MSMETWYPAAQALAVFGGVLVGIFAVFSPSWVWLKKQLFGWGGAVMACIGTILIVSSIFKSVAFGISPTSGIELKLTALQQQLAETTASLVQVQGQVTSASTVLAKYDPVALTEIQQELRGLVAASSSLGATVQRIGGEVGQLKSSVASANATANAVLVQLKASEKTQDAPYKTIPYIDPGVRPQPEYRAVVPRPGMD